MQPVLDDEARGPCGEAELRFDGFRDPHEVGALVGGEAAGRSDPLGVLSNPFDVVAGRTASGTGANEKRVRFFVWCKFTGLTS